VAGVGRGLDRSQAFASARGELAEALTAPPSGDRPHGSAAGATKEDAGLRALLEAIERDAAARWWQGRLRRPEVLLEQVADTRLIALIAWCRNRWRSHVIDLANDCGVTVLAAWSTGAVGGPVALGFGADLDPERALAAALTEMIQVVIGRELTSGLPVSAAPEALRDRVARERRWLEAVRSSTHPHLLPTGSVALRPSVGGTAAGPFATVLGRLTGRRHGVRIALQAAPWPDLVVAHARVSGFETAGLDP
jgi:ribosomal protein S12 methylthiotransferase accessory factor YcaO